uniref:Uncharacterized protein n=1 Tax=Spongospora subterranea TaxID=70186 RepID=A0A0H5RQA9_9EUKA|eukprot:CRZ10894.1 hypothetical protein [Spongospora subterranea]
MPAVSGARTGRHDVSSSIDIADLLVRAQSDPELHHRIETDSDLSLARDLLFNDRFATADRADDLLDQADCGPVCSIALYCRLLDPGSVDDAVIRYRSLMTLYSLSYHHLYANLISSHIRVLIQRKGDIMLYASYLLYRLPLVIARLEHDRRPNASSSQLNDVELAIASITPFPLLTTAQMISNVTWFDALVNVLSSHSLIRFESLNSIGLQLFPLENHNPPVPLPPQFSHADSIVCSSSSDLVAVVDAICSADVGTGLTTDLIPELIDLALTQPIMIPRLQHLVVGKLIPRLVAPEFRLCLSTLNASLARLTTQSAIDIIAMHGQLREFTDALLAQWIGRADAIIQVDDLRQYNHEIEVISRCQFILLYIMQTNPVPLAHLAEFRSKAVCGPATPLPDEVKQIGIALANVTSSTSPEASSWGDAIRLTASTYPLTMIICAVRFAILPNMYAKMQEQEKYFMFLRVLVMSFPFLSTTIVDFLAMSLTTDIAAKKSIAPHFSAWQCVLNATRRLSVPVILQIYKEKIAQVLAGAETIEADFAASVGSGHLVSMIRGSDCRFFFLKHARFLLKSHYMNMSAAWKDIDLHSPIFRYCLDKLGPSDFVETLVAGLIVRAHDPQSNSSDSARIPQLRTQEIVAAIICAAGGRRLARLAVTTTLNKAPTAVCLALVLTDAAEDDFLLVWNALFNDMESAFDVNGSSYHAATLLSCCPRAMNAFHMTNGHIRLAEAFQEPERTFPFLSPSNPDHCQLVQRLLHQSQTRKDDPFDCDVPDESFSVPSLVHLFKSIANR